ncbi:sigma-54 interaction domain-containing protein [Thermoflavimicrobium dichotomicum]|uniref:HTH-type transcriptional regulatory protein TyrR n=1 Tax=Thermoflavimicrobium dichotomicum TaxID=46223 RepID=A0A1I3JPA2_9BACL|nr:sigma 54-interacting transcriptional regulator [Thermoflavimicrobium dichotomicum]SFI62071.1 PAS domain S-box-containing protein [Thermoflavimicrobium dichotomicum]
MSDAEVREHSFKLKEQEWEEIFHSCFDGIWVADHEGKTIWVNKAYERLAGIEAKSVLGRSAQELMESGVLSYSAIPGVMKTHKPVTIINKMGDKQLLVTGVPVFDENHKLSRIVCNVRDITQLTELQKEIEKKRKLIHHYEMEIQKLQEQLQTLGNAPIMKNKTMVQLFETAKRVASTQSTVLILGESGVGKEVLANWIHRMSPRSAQPYIKVNCSVLPESLIESELFGYEKGAFTGAQSGKAGLFEAADKGTIFLDEIGELPLRMQAKLLRVLQEKEIQRIGARQAIPVDVRVIAATNRSLEKMVADGLFREDLYYRLNVVPFTIPPLRERKEDIPLLIAQFLNEFRRIYNREVEISPVVLDKLVHYHWPGNVRELKNIIERLVVITTKKEITLEDLPEYLRMSPTPPDSLWETPPLTIALKHYEKQLIIKTLEKCRSIRQAARLLKVDHSTLVRKIQQLEIDYKSILGKNIPHNGNTSFKA